MKKRRFIIAALVVLFCAMLFAYGYFNGMHRRIYDLIRFSIPPVISFVDHNRNWKDDYIDIVAAAREYTATNPEYKDAYYQGGYPDKGEGVCTDVIWNAFLGAGYDLKAMVDEDIQNNTSAYLGKGKRDTNIDFRRVTNLNTFFKRNAISLTTDMDEIDQWQAGDIVVYQGHIAIISTIRNPEGRPYIIHHAGYGCLEEDRLDYKKIIGHYRW